MANLPVSRVVFGDKFRPGFTVVSAEVEDHDRMIDKATVVLDDPNGIAAAAAYPGTAVIVELGWEDESAVLFHGLVETSQSCVGGGAGKTTVVVYDDGILMHRDRRRKSYTGLLSSVVDEVLARYGSKFSVKNKPDPNPEFTDKRKLVQANLTDYEFLNQVALYYGARSFVEWDSELQSPVYWFVSNKELQSSKSIGSLEYCCGYSKLLEFDCQRVAGRAGTQMVATVMDTESGDPVETVGPTPPATPVPPSPKDAPTSGATADVLAAADTKAKELASTPPPPTPLGPQPSDKARSDVLAVRDPTRILGWTGKGRAIGTVKMTAKSKVTIKGITPWAEGDWYVGMAVHRYQRVTSGDRSSATYETSFMVTR
ncbi:MAG TPA: hypothetical protein VGJ86_10480 [Acidimicrobiales bacterium]|jgi:hypothetical protein